MPLKNVRFRRKGKMRLAFKEGTDKVVEAKNMETGEVHTEEEMMHDEEMAKKRKRMMKKKRMMK